MDCKHHFDMTPKDEPAIRHHDDGKVTICAATCRHCNKTAAEIARLALDGATFEWPDKPACRIVDADGNEVG